MAVVVEKENVQAFIDLASAENLEATPVATVTAEPRLTMKWNGRKIVDVSREFLNSNGAEKHITAKVEKPKDHKAKISGGFSDNYRALADNLNICSKRGLS